VYGAKSNKLQTWLDGIKYRKLIACIRKKEYHKIPKELLTPIVFIRPVGKTTILGLLFESGGKLSDLPELNTSIALPQDINTRASILSIATSYKKLHEIPAGLYSKETLACIPSPPVIAGEVYSGKCGEWFLHYTTLELIAAAGELHQIPQTLRNEEVFGAAKELSRRGFLQIATWAGQLEYVPKQWLVEYTNTKNVEYNLLHIATKHHQLHTVPKFLITEQKLLEPDFVHDYGTVFHHAAAEKQLRVLPQEFVLKNLMLWDHKRKSTVFDEVIKSESPDQLLGLELPDIFRMATGNTWWEKNANILKGRSQLITKSEVPTMEIF